MSVCISHDLRFARGLGAGSGVVVFATSGQIGLDTAVGVLTRGFVVVGNLPVTYPPPPGSPTPGQGTLQFFDRNGNQVLALSDAALLDSPWDLAINDQGAQAQIFVSNVLMARSHG